jgi:hypothetical protein
MMSEQVYCFSEIPFQIVSRSATSWFNFVSNCTFLAVKASCVAAILNTIKYKSLKLLYSQGMKYDLTLTLQNQEWESSG